MGTVLANSRKLSMTTTSNGHAELAELQFTIYMEMCGLKNLLI